MPHQPAVNKLTARDVQYSHYLLPVMWLLLAFAFMYGVVARAYLEAEEDFDTRSAALRDHMAGVLLSNEAVLEGFSGLLGVMDEVDFTKISHYAERMRSHYPQIFMLEFAVRVDHADLAHFESVMATAGHQGFKVRTFSFEGDRAWRALPVKPHYYPIVFMDPMPAESMQVLGLDIDSVPFLQDALATSQRQGRYVASHPFRLVEGDWAYVMHRAVETSRSMVALLVVKADALLSQEKTPRGPAMAINLWHRAFTEGDERGILLRRQGGASSALERALLPRLRNSTELGGAGQPFGLTVERQLRWADFNLTLLAGLTFINLSMFIMLLWHAKYRCRRALEKHRQSEQWAYLASHDPLTSLPNRFLLMDRLEGALLRAQREKQLFALIFMDLDEFKQVNDRFGHQAGDLVLQQVAKSILSVLRAQDTVARISGDEFVAVLEGVSDRGQAESVARKIQAAMPESMGPEYPGLRIGISLGIAMYPEDGASVDELLRGADAAMYRMKRQGRAGESQTD